MAHSKIVGGSTAKRVINCPGSVGLVAKVPYRPAGPAAELGTALHEAMEYIIQQGLTGGFSAVDAEGETFNDIEITREHVEVKLNPALTILLQEVLPETEGLDCQQEVEVFFQQNPEVFGSVDLIGRDGDRVYIVDWKFGDGVKVDAEQNEQLMFYAAAAMQTPALARFFEGAKYVEGYIVQPPNFSVCRFEFADLRAFERQLFRAIKQSQFAAPVVRAGEHCRFCPAKVICPEQNGAVKRLLAHQVQLIDTQELAAALEVIPTLESRIEELKALAQTVMENGGTVPGYKLVPKRATRKWVDEPAAYEALKTLKLSDEEIFETAIRSPAQVEKVLKKHKLPLPQEHVVAVSSGNTIAPESDPRPAVLLIGQQLSAALGKLI